MPQQSPSKFEPILRFTSLKEDQSDHPTEDDPIVSAPTAGPSKLLTAELTNQIHQEAQVVPTSIRLLVEKKGRRLGVPRLVPIVWTLWD